MEEGSGNEDIQDISYGSTMSRTRRRTRRTDGDRSFVCGCGKDYLSYPALYTHIKQKHNGEMPSGTETPSNSRSRGRPRRVLSQSGPQNEEQDEILKEEGLFGGPCDPISA